MSAGVSVCLSVFLYSSAFSIFEIVSPVMISSGSHGREDEPRKETVSGDSYRLQARR